MTVKKKGAGFLDLGLRLKEYRTSRGLSQSELAKLVGVTPSTISQVESNLIYPSLPALLKMTEVLDIEISDFFQEKSGFEDRVVYHSAEAAEVRLPPISVGDPKASLLFPKQAGERAELYLIEIPPGQSSSHFFNEKGEEIGYVLSGNVLSRLQRKTYSMSEGDVIHLKNEIPLKWENPEPTPARLLWFKLK